MLNTRRPEIAARDYSSTEEAAFITWAEGIKGSKSNQPKSGAWSRRTSTQIYGEEEFQWSDKPPVDESGVLSPKLWEPTSRAEAIAGFRQEMMDLVKDVPESAYELSLKDLVEMPRVGRERGEITIHEEEAEKGRAQVKKGVKRSMSRSESLDSGVFLLKMFLPFSFAGNRSKSCGGGGSKVSPRPAGGKREYGDRSSSSGSSEGSIISYGSRYCHILVTDKGTAQFSVSPHKSHLCSREAHATPPRRPFRDYVFGGKLRSPLLPFSFFVQIPRTPKPCGPFLHGTPSSSATTSSFLLPSLHPSTNLNSLVSLLDD